MFPQKLLPAVLIGLASHVIISNGKPTAEPLKSLSSEALLESDFQQLSKSDPGFGFATQKSFGKEKRGLYRCGRDFGPCDEGYCCSLHGKLSLAWLSDYE